MLATLKHIAVLPPVMQYCYKRKLLILLFRILGVSASLYTMIIRFPTDLIIKLETLNFNTINSNALRHCFIYTYTLCVCCCACMHVRVCT